ncbi:MAG: orotidine-5'-phosphate decarboxylase [Rhodospirillales bacterium]|nr:orotidine-5'-phosphate decarboxylase [Rhodospirillales bacterium]
MKNPQAARVVPHELSRRLIVGLDVSTVAAARKIIDRLDGIVSFYKIGPWLAYADGAEALIRDLTTGGRELFLDVKLHDIGQTVEQGVARAAERGASFVTVHAEPQVMAAAVRGAADSAIRILGITVLTSLDDDALREAGYAEGVDALVRRRARQAVICGVHGIVASAADDPRALRAAAGSERLLVVTPGIRPAGAAKGDQIRVATPAEALANGSDYLVVGRPVIAADDPAAAARAILEEMAAGG